MEKTVTLSPAARKRIERDPRKGYEIAHACKMSDGTLSNAKNGKRILKTTAEAVRKEFKMQPGKFYSKDCYTPGHTRAKAEDMIDLMDPDRLKSDIKAAGYSNNQISEMIGRGKTYVRTMIRDGRMPIKELAKICEIINSDQKIYTMPLSVDVDQKLRRVAWITEGQKRRNDLRKDLLDLCRKYSVSEVVDEANDIQSDIACYMEGTCGINLLEILDESMNGIPEVDFKVAQET